MYITKYLHVQSLTLHFAVQFSHKIHKKECPANNINSTVIHIYQFQSESKIDLSDIEFTNR